MDGGFGLGPELGRRRGLFAQQGPDLVVADQRRTPRGARCAEPGAARSGDQQFGIVAAVLVNAAAT